MLPLLPFHSRQYPVHSPYLHALALLCSSMNEGTDLHTLADVEKSDALRAVQLVSAGAEHVDVILVYIDRQLAVCLHGIGVEQNSMLLCDLSDLFDRLNRSDLIVCKHHRNKDRIRADRSFQLVDLYLAVLIDIDIGIS